MTPRARPQGRAFLFPPPAASPTIQPGRFLTQSTDWRRGGEAGTGSDSIPTVLGKFSGSARFARSESRSSLRSRVNTSSPAAPQDFEMSSLRSRNVDSKNGTRHRRVALILSPNSSHCSESPKCACQELRSSPRKSSVTGWGDSLEALWLASTERMENSR